MAWLPDGEKFLKICLFVLTQLTNVTDTHTHTHTHTDRQTDRQTDRHRMTAYRPRLCIASCGKKHLEAYDKSTVDRPVWYGKTRIVGLPDGEKNFEDMYNRLHTIPACDGQTDGRTDRQTSCHGIVRSMHTRRAVITVPIPVSVARRWIK